jgi:phosphoribosylformimino-5-aminoimidazole carboxamide ribotide isomerase
MILFPAIDLKDGHCVRLKRGDMQSATVFNTDPAAQAEAFERQGFQWLHLVDLNGAFAGRPVNGEAVETILQRVAIPVQLGGGIRDLATIAMWLDKGVSRVILGTVAARNPGLVREAAKLYPDRIAVGIDARNGQVAVEGWGETSALSARDVAMRFADAGIAAIIYTDIDRDGMLQGINIDSTLSLAESVPVPVIASGGLGSMADIERLSRPDCAPLAGVIAGRALYDGRIDPAMALAIFANRTVPA